MKHIDLGFHRLHFIHGFASFHGHPHAARPDLNGNDQHKHEGALGYLLMRPWLWVHVPAFVHYPRMVMPGSSSRGLPWPP